MTLTEEAPASSEDAGDLVRSAINAITAAQLGLIRNDETYGVRQKLDEAQAHLRAALEASQAQEKDEQRGSQR